jgi:hypothetical protein
MAEQLNYQINVGGNASESIGSLKKQLREAQNEVAALSDKFGATSKEAVQAAKRAAELKDRIGDAKALTDAFSPDAKFKALSASLSGVAGGFAAVQGAIGLFGAESKELEKQLLKVQSALALSQGLQAVGESIDSFKNLKTVAVDAFKSIKVAIGSTGIGLLVVALGTIVAYWDDIKAALSGVTEEQKTLNAESQKNLESQKEKLDAIDGQSNQLKLQGKSEKEILQLKIKQTDEAIKAAEINLINAKNTKNAQVEVTKRNYEITKGLLNFLSLPITAVLAAADALGQALGKNWNLREQFTGGVAKLLFDPKEVAAEGDKAIKEAESVLNGLKEKRASSQLQIQAIDKAAADKSKADAKKNADEIARQEAAEEERKRAKEEKESAAQKVQIDAFRATLKQREQDILKAEDELESKKAILIQAGNFDFQRIEEENRIRIAEINAKYDQEELDKQKEIDDKKREAAEKEVERKREYEERKRQFEIESQQLTEELLSKREQLLLNGLNVLGSIAGENEKIANTIFAIQKGLEIAKVISSASASIGQIIASTQAIPPILPPGVPNPAYISAVALGAKRAAIVKVGAAAQIAGIAATSISKFKNGGGSVAGSVSGQGSSTPIAPQQPQAITTNISQSSINALGNSAIKAYVLETDVTTNQKRVAAIKQRARFG